MRATTLRQKAWWLTASGAARIMPPVRLHRPVFIIGCKRSGTTILERVLEEHPVMVALHEPKEYWCNAFPACNVWDGGIGASGRFRMSAADWDEEAGRRLRKLFWLAVRRQRPLGRVRMLEKYPINTFRLEFVDRIFPDALFIHIIRDGRDVAASIEKQNERNPATGPGSYRWKCFRAYAREVCPELFDDCAGSYDFGLLEWRLAIETARASASALGSRYLEVRYEELVKAPRGELCSILDFIGESGEERVLACGEEQLEARERSKRVLGASQRRLAGDMLRQLGYDA